jgi:hypothetical protein
MDIRERAGWEGRGASCAITFDPAQQPSRQIGEIVTTYGK